MRQIVLDTETTGLDWRTGDRVIEIGCVELVNRRATGRTFHVYIHPDREVPEEAIRIHGITNEFLADKPRFAVVLEEFVEFVRDAELVIHNASFDMGFLNNELTLHKHVSLDRVGCKVLDTLKLAREQNPGKRASLDALCDRYGINNKHRQYHGALLDAQLLADVYLAMTRGQNSLLGGGEDDAAASAAAGGAHKQRNNAANRPPLPKIVVSAEELAAHQAYLQDVDKASGGKCVWLALDAVQPEEAETV